MGACTSKKEVRPPEILIKTSTWNRDSHGLFDYEGRECQKKQLKTSGTLTLARHETNVMIEDEEYKLLLDQLAPESKKPQQIARLIEKNGEHWIFHTSTVDESEDALEKNFEKKLWRVVRYCTSSNKQILGYKLQHNDLIKLGRVRFRVKEIVSPAYQKMAQARQHKQKKYQQL